MEVASQEAQKTEKIKNLEVELQGAESGSGVVVGGRSSWRVIHNSDPDESGDHVKGCEQLTSKNHSE